MKKSKSELIKTIESLTAQIIIKEDSIKISLINQIETLTSQLVESNKLTNTVIAA